MLLKSKRSSIQTSLTLLASIWVAAVLPLLMLQPASAYADVDTLNNQQEVFSKVRIEQKLDTQLPMDLMFRDETGSVVRLGDLFTGRPVLITPVYYSCPMLCNLVLTGLVKALKILKFTPGKDFDIISFSINPHDKPELAAASKQRYLEEYKRPEASSGWRFLTGDQEAIDSLTDAVGFRYAWDPVAKEYAHAAGIMVATPQGRLSHYFYGIEYSPKDIRLALVDSAKGKIGDLMDQFLLLCYHYDPSTGKYGFTIIRLLRLFCALTVVGLALFIIRSLKEERKPLKAGL